MKKSFFAGLGISLLAVIVLAVAGYAAFMTGGTRLLYENSEGDSRLSDALQRWIRGL